MPNKFQKVADPGVWILLLLIILIIGFGLYDFYKDAGINSRITIFWSEIKEEFNSLDRVESENFVDLVNTNANYSTNTNLTTNNNSNVNNTAINNTNQNTNTPPLKDHFSEFKWFNIGEGESLMINDIIMDNDYDLILNVNKLGTGSNQANVDFHYSDRNTFNGPITNVGDANLDLPIAQNSSLIGYATTLYRTHYYCDNIIDDSIFFEGKEIIDLTTGYSNFTCGNRKKIHCQSFNKSDTYYDEMCDFENVTFYEGDAKCFDNLVILAITITTKSLNIGITEKNDNESCLDYSYAL